MKFASLSRCRIAAVAALLLICGLQLVARAQDAFGLQLVGRYTQPAVDYKIQSVVVRSTYLYAAIVGGGLKIFDVANAAVPKEVGALNLAGETLQITLDGNFAYVAGGTVPLQVVDVSDVTQPRLVGTLQHEFIRNAMGVATKGDTAFIGSAWGLFAADISNPSEPKYREQMTSRFVSKVVVDGNRLFTTQSPDYSVFDVSDPRAPTFIASHNVSGRGFQIWPDGNHLYKSAVLEDGVVKFNITNPAAPVYERTFSLIGFPPDHFVIAGTNLYGLMSTALFIFNLNDPPGTMPLQRILGEALSSITVVDGRLYGITATGVAIFDLSNPNEPRWIGQIDPTRAGNNVEVSGAIALVAGGAAGLEIFDVLNPTVIRRVGNYRTVGSAHKVKRMGSLAYVATGMSGLEIVNVAEPSAPRLVGAIDTPGRAVDLFVDETTQVAYVADSWGGLQIIDVNDPARPALLRTVQFEGRVATAVDVENGVACVAADGVNFLDVRDPANPGVARDTGNFGPLWWLDARQGIVFAGGTHAITMPNAQFEIRDLNPTGKQNAKDGMLAGDYLFMTDDAALTVFDVADPAAPRVIVTATNEPARGVAMQGDFVYVSAVAGDLLVYRAGLPPRIIVTPPTSGAKYLAGETIAIEWTIENFANPIWKLTLGANTLDATPQLGIDGKWRAQVTIPLSATNSVGNQIVIREETLGVEGTYGLFAIEEIPRLSIQRFGAQFVVRWNLAHSDFKLITTTNLNSAWTNAETNSGNFFFSNGYAIFQDQVIGEAQFYQLVRQP